MGRLGTAEKTLVGVAGLCALAFAALAIHAASGVTFALDGGIRDAMRQNQHAAVQLAMSTVSSLGTAIVLIPLIGLVSCLAWRRCSPRHALVVPLAMTGAGALQFASKWAVDRPRPNLSEWGFPSGHVLIVVVLGGLVCYLASVAGMARSRQCFVTVMSSATVLAVAVSRLYLDMHWFSDVIGGFAVGLTYLLAVIVAFELFRQSSDAVAALEAAGEPLLAPDPVRPTR